MALEVVEMTAGHWSQVERIYAEGIATGNATFELEPPSQADFEAQHLPGLALVALDEARVIGWAALSQAAKNSPS